MLSDEWSESACFIIKDSQDSESQSTYSDNLVNIYKQLPALQATQLLQQNVYQVLVALPQSVLNLLCPNQSVYAVVRYLFFRSFVKQNAYLYEAKFRVRQK